MSVAYGVLLLAILCSSGSLGQWLGGGDFLNLNGMFANIQENVQRSVAQLNQEIHSQVRSHLTDVEKFQKDLREKIATSISMVDPGKGNVIVINSNAGSVGVNPGGSRAIYSGYTPEGKPYYQDSERTVVNGILHHFERVYDPGTQKVKEYHYTLDLNDPGAKPIEVRMESNDEKQTEKVEETKETKESKETKETKETKE